MTKSALATAIYPADPSNYTEGRGTTINKITLHHMAGIMTSEQCGSIFARAGRGGSANYGIGKDGDIAMYVDEDNTPWTDSNWSSNCRSITIESSNDSIGGEWHVSDATLDSCIKLVADIAKRYNMGALVPGQNLTWHSMYVSTTCPGDYMRSKMQYIADEANEINSATPEPIPDTPAPTPTPSADGFAAGDKVVPKEYVDYYGTRLVKTRDFYFISSVSGNRAVLAADYAGGPVYAAMNTNNLTKEGDSTPVPAPSGEITVGAKVVPISYVSYEGVPLLKTRDFYYVSSINGNRVVLSADSTNGAIYAAINKDNLSLVGSSQPTPAPTPADDTIRVGDRVVLKTWTDINGQPLAQTRNFYYISELNGNRAVLRADSMNGAVYCAADVNNLRKV